FAQEARAVAAVKARMMGLAAGRQFPQMAAQFAYAQRHADPLGGERLAVRAQHARVPVEAARRQRDVGGDADIAGGDMLRDPVIGGIRAFRHRDMTHQGIGGRPQAAIADDGDGQAVPSRHLLDLGLYRAGIAINKYLHAPSESSAGPYQAALPRFLSPPRFQCGREPLRFLGAWASAGAGPPWRWPPPGWPPPL